MRQALRHTCALLVLVLLAIFDLYQSNIINLKQGVTYCRNIIHRQLVSYYH